MQAEALKEKEKTIVALKEEIASLRGAPLQSIRDESTAGPHKLRLPSCSPRKEMHSSGGQVQFYGQDHDPSTIAEHGLVHMADDVRIYPP